MDPLFSKSDARTRFTDLDDAAEVGAEERRGGAGGPAPLGRGRRQHLRHLPLPWLLLLLCSAQGQGSAAASAPVDCWSSGALPDLMTVASQPQRAREIWLAALASRLPSSFAACGACYCYRRWLWEWPTSTNCFVRGFGLCCPAQSIYIIIYTNVSKKICIQILVKSLIKFFNYEKYL